MKSCSMWLGALAWCGSLLADVVTMENRGEFPLETFIAYTKDGKMVPKDGNNVLTLPVFHVINPGASATFERPPRVFGLDRDAVAREINTNRDKEDAQYQKFIQGKAKLPEQGDYAARYNIGSYKSKVFFGRNEDNKLDGYSTASQVIKLGSIGSAGSIGVGNVKINLPDPVMKSIIASEVKAYQDAMQKYEEGWQAFLNNLTNPMNSAATIPAILPAWTKRLQFIAEYITECRYLYYLPLGYDKER